MFQAATPFWGAGGRSIYKIYIFPWHSGGYRHHPPPHHHHHPAPGYGPAKHLLGSLDLSSLQTFPSQCNTHLYNPNVLSGFSRIHISDEVGRSRSRVTVVLPIPPSPAGRAPSRPGRSPRPSPESRPPSSGSAPRRGRPGAGGRAL